MIPVAKKKLLKLLNFLNKHLDKSLENNHHENFLNTFPVKQDPCLDVQPPRYRKGPSTCFDYNVAVRIHAQTHTDKHIDIHKLHLELQKYIHK